MKRLVIIAVKQTMVWIFLKTLKVFMMQFVKNVLY